MTHLHRLKVRGYHCDFYGHVNNARYLEFLEEARWGYLEEGLDLGYWQQRGLGFIVASVTINYRRPAAMGVDLEIRSHMSHLGGKSGVIHQEVVNLATGKTVADADVTFVVVNLATGKAQAMSGEVREGFDRVAAGLAARQDQADD
jgi:thioesterase-3|nr:thioesterase family protein [Candidatus Krumholzibacteria bacterium]